MLSLTPHPSPSSVVRDVSPPYLYIDHPPPFCFACVQYLHSHLKIDCHISLHLINSLKTSRAFSYQSEAGLKKARWQTSSTFIFPPTNRQHRSNPHHHSTKKSTALDTPSPLSVSSNHTGMSAISSKTVRAHELDSSPDSPLNNALIPYELDGTGSEYVVSPLTSVSGSVSHRDSNASLREELHGSKKVVIAALRLWSGPSNRASFGPDDYASTYGLQGSEGMEYSASQSMTIKGEYFPLSSNPATVGTASSSDLGQTNGTGRARWVDEKMAVNEPRSSIRTESSPQGPSSPPGLNALGKARKMAGSATLVLSHMMNPDGSHTGGVNIMPTRTYTANNIRD